MAGTATILWNSLLNSINTLGSGLINAWHHIFPNFG